MLLALELSIFLYAVAFCWALALWWKVRDWRLAMLPFVIALVCVQEGIRGAMYDFESEPNNLHSVVELIFAFALNGVCLLLVYSQSSYWAMQKQSQDAIFLSESRHRSVINSLAEGVMLIDNDGVIQAANPSVAVIFCAPSEKSFIGVPLSDPSWQTIREDGTRFKYDDFPAMESLRTGRPIVDVVMGVGVVTGEVRWIQINTQPILGTEGRTTGVVASFQDVTERKKTAAALQESEERFRQIAEYVESAFLLIEWPSMKGIYASPAFERIWGVSPSEALVDPARRYAHIVPEDRERVSSCFLSELPQEHFDQTIRQAMGDNPIRWIRERAFPIRNQVGEVYRIACIASDVSERRRFEETLRQRDAELAHASRVGTLGEMAAQIAHEVNQPLFAISNLAATGLQNLKSGPLTPDELTNSWEKIATLANRAGTIVRRILNFVKRHEVSRDMVDAVTMTRETMALVESRAASSHVRIERDIPASLPMVFCDSVLIQQVLLNLLNNALDSLEETPEENRLLGVKVWMPDASQVQVSVTDSGVGFGEGELAKLFQPFHTTKPNGVGMGLAICRTTIESHGGRLWAEPNRTGGAIFHFILPMYNEGLAKQA